MKSILLMLGACLVTTSLSAADLFERHSPDVLRKYISRSKPAAALTMPEAAKLKPLGPRLEGAGIVVKTNDGRVAKALVSFGFRKGADGKPVPVVLLNRFATYRDSDVNATVAAGKDLMLCAGLSCDLDIGQIVPADLGGDLVLTAEGVLQPGPEAQLYLLDGPQIADPESTVKPEPNPQDHDGVLPRDFSGVWAVDADGRWLGRWELTADENGNLKGSFYSAETQSDYPITGKIVAREPHRAKLNIALANAELAVDAYIWTKDKNALAGTVTLSGRTFGVYAVRQTGEKDGAK